MPPGPTPQADPSRSTTLSYDSTGRIASETTGAVTITYGYDAASQLLSVTPTAGSALVYSYDVLGRRSTERVGAAAATKFVYDAAGQLCWTTTANLPSTASCGNPVTNVARFSWDPAGRLTNETRTATNRVDYAYDPAGRLDTITRVNGATTSTQTRGYSADGLLADTSTTVATAAAFTSTASSFVWDPTVGRVPQLSSITNTAGVVSNLTYGATGWAAVHSSAAAHVPSD